tara:strand:+ start:60 stop:1103 length:1044 start_codon:yes stop_codon:yes gene_type:complete
MKLNNKKLVPLDKFIEQSLYNKKTGYYMKKNPFGSGGDFITGPNISVLFSEMITIWLVDFWYNLKTPKKINLVELGGGNAEMMFQIIKTSKNFPLFKKACNFFIYEKSPYLEKIQKKKLKSFEVNWLKNFDKLDKAPTIFVGNEFLDAFPIKQLIKKNKVWFEKYVDLSSKFKKFVEIKTNLNKYEKKLGINFSKNQEIIEFSPQSFKILKTISKIINKFNGGLLIIDYGYFEEKMFDSLQSVKDHKKNNIFEEISNADITHMLNLNLIEKILNKFKLKIKGKSSQRDFLISLGILNRAEIISKKLPFSKKADIYYRLKRLLDKNQMGELFKVFFASNKKNNFKTGF